MQTAGDVSHEGKARTATEDCAPRWDTFNTSCRLPRQNGLGSGDSDVKMALSVNDVVDMWC